MRVLKVTTKEDKIASVHLGDIQNISRMYHIISTIAKDYNWLFSKPKVTKSKIFWESEIEGDIVSFKDATPAQKNQIKAILKEAIYSIIYSKTQEQIELLRAALEIPDEEDILYIGSKVILTQWGHIKSVYNARRGIVFDLIDAQGLKLKLKVTQDGLPVSGALVEFSFDGYSFSVFANSKGEAEIFLPKDKEISLRVEDTQEFITLKRDSSLEIELPPLKLSSQTSTKESKKESFTIDVRDCENDTFIVGDGELIVRIDNKSYSFPIKEGKAKIDKFFGKEVLVDSKVRGYISKSQTKFNITPNGSGSLCLYPMIELQKEGSLGDPRFNITWAPSPEDIDIMVLTPCGNLIYYGEKEKFCDGFKGVLDIDIREIECQKREDNCQENITFDNGGPRGEYTVIVKKYYGTDNEVEVVLTIVNNGQKSVERFTLKEVDEEKRFKIIH